MSNGSVIFLSVLLVAVYIRLITVRLVTDVGPSEVSVGLRGLWRMKHVPVHAIRTAKPVQYNAASEYGGYGMRSGPRGPAYIAHGDRGVELELTDGSKLLIGSQHPDELVSRILQVKQSAG